jgi:hypothetical protein
MFLDQKRQSVILKALTTLIVGLTLAFGVGVSATATAATAPEPAEPTAQQPAADAPTLGVSDILRLNPQARQVGPNRVRIADGIDLLLPNRSTTSATGTQMQMVSSGCNWSTGYLCVWEHERSWKSNGGYGLSFTSCTADDVDLGRLRYPDGRSMSDYVPGQRWNDRISSMDNHQTRGTRANFYNWEGYWKLVFWTYAPDRRANLSIDKRMDNGGQINDVIDRIDPC